jgi:hypothetical protein
MTEALYPDATISSTEGLSLFVIGAATLWQALDASTASYVAASGPASLTVSLTDPTMTDVQLVSVTVEFDARPVAAFAANLNLPVVADLVDPNTGTFYARSTWTYNGSSGFTAATLNYGSVISRDLANRLRIFLRMGPRGLYTHQYETNDVRMVATDLFDGPTATATGPTGAINDNTPTLQWTATVDDAATETEVYGRWRVFTAAQYSAGGFDPATSPATWDSGLRASAGHAVTTVPLAPGAYRAYISAVQRIVLGSPWTSRPNATEAEKFPLQAGPYAFTAFTIVPAAPVVLPPRIPVDAARDLTTTQRALLLEATRPVSRASLFTSDGVFVRDLTIVARSSSRVTLDAAAQIRGSLDLVCSDTDIVPANRAEASGENMPLHPFGSYVHVSYGLDVGHSDPDIMIGLGVFRLTNVKRDLSTGRVTIKGKDFAQNLLESRFSYPITRQSWDTNPPTPFLIYETVRAIISEAGLAYRVATSTSTRVVANYVHKIGDERPRALDGLAAAVDGWTWYADIDGAIYFGPGPDIIIDPLSYTFDTGDAPDRLIAQIVDREQELTRDDVFDVVVAYDQAVTVVGGAYDANPDSVIARSAADPTSLLTGAGSFSPGGKPFFYSSPTITSTPGAQSAAQLRLRGVALPAEQVTATCVPIPDLRPDKMVAMARDGETALVKWQVVKTITPLTIGPPMTWSGVALSEDVEPAS